MSLTEAIVSNTLVIVVHSDEQHSTRGQLFDRLNGTRLTSIAGVQHGTTVSIAWLRRAVVHMWTAVRRTVAVRVSQNHVINIDHVTSIAGQVQHFSLADLNN